MELLILSKLKWDLTTVTAYDYLDHLLEALHRNNSSDNDAEADSRLLESSHLESLRKQVKGKSMIILLISNHKLELVLSIFSKFHK